MLKVVDTDFVYSGRAKWVVMVENFHLDKGKAIDLEYRCQRTQCRASHDGSQRWMMNTIMLEAVLNAGFGHEMKIYTLMRSL